METMMMYLKEQPEKRLSGIIPGSLRCMVEYLDGLVRAAARKQHDDKANNPEDSLERKLHYAKANVEQCLHRTINLYVKLIDDRAHTSRLQKKTSDIDSRIVWPSFDIAKV